jgi:hypothetical protein
VVVSSDLSGDRVALLRKFMEGGGAVLKVLKTSAAASSAAALMGQETLDVEEAQARQFSLISRVQLDHPIFTPFADPRFADFTTIHFWRHRRVRLGDSSPARVLVWFDSGDPFLIEQPLGEGRLIVATSGWHPADSQLARSTKFVPLLAGMIPRTESTIGQNQATVFEQIALPAAQDDSTRIVHKADGSEIQLAAAATSFDGADEPGIYRVTLDGKQVPIAVNLSSDESRTTALTVDDLEQRGAKIGTQATAEQIAERQRQLRLTEIESRQKLWRWLIVAVLALLLSETALAGRLAHRTLQQPVLT